MENLIDITIDGQTIRVDSNENIVEACARAGVKIPTLLSRGYFPMPPVVSALSK